MDGKAGIDAPLEHEETSMKPSTVAVYTYQSALVPPVPKHRLVAPAPWMAHRPCRSPGSRGRRWNSRRLGH